VSARKAYPLRNTPQPYVTQACEGPKDAAEIDACRPASEIINELRLVIV